MTSSISRLSGGMTSMTYGCGFPIRLCLDLVGWKSTSACATMGRRIQEPNLTQVEQIVGNLCASTVSGRLPSVFFIHTAILNTDKSSIILCGVGFRNYSFPAPQRSYLSFSNTNVGLRPSSMPSFSRAWIRISRELKMRLSRLGFKGGFYIMTSSGGTFTADMGAVIPCAC